MQSAQTSAETKAQDVNHRARMLAQPDTVCLSERATALQLPLSRCHDLQG